MPAPERRVVAANVRAEMARRRLPQIALADRLGITQQAVSMKLAGRRPLTDTEVAAIADFLSVEPGSLFADHAAVRSAS